MTPAAAVTEGCIVVLPEGREFEIARVLSGTPQPGKVTWESHFQGTVEIPAAMMVQVNTWPTRKDPMTALDVLKRGSRR